MPRPRPDDDPLVTACCRVQPEEKAWLEALALYEGLTMSSWLRMTVLNVVQHTLAELSEDEIDALWQAYERQKKNTSRKPALPTPPPYIQHGATRPDRL
jgi:hypothetical protein